MTLYFAAKGWAHGALALTVFAATLIVARIVGGHLPDRFGGARVALSCLVAQAAGMVAIAAASSGPVAMMGAAIAGAGFSLVFPSLGLEAVRRAPADNRGLAMGTYNAFLDLTLGLGSPVLLSHCTRRPGRGILGQRDRVISRGADRDRAATQACFLGPAALLKTRARCASVHARTRCHRP